MPTPLFNLNELTEGSASAEIEYNENVRWLEALAGALVIDQTDTPPGSPNEGDFYIIDVSATGSWTGRDGQLALFVNGAWQFREAPLHYGVFVVALNELRRFDGTTPWYTWTNP